MHTAWANHPGVDGDAHTRLRLVRREQYRSGKARFARQKAGLGCQNIALGGLTSGFKGQCNGPKFIEYSAIL